MIFEFVGPGVEIVLVRLRLVLVIIFVVAVVVVVIVLVGSNLYWHSAGEAAKCADRRGSRP